MANEICEGKVNGKTGRCRPRWTFENMVSIILDEGYVRSTRTPPRLDDSGQSERGMQRS